MSFSVSHSNSCHAEYALCSWYCSINKYSGNIQSIKESFWSRTCFRTRTFISGLWQWNNTLQKVYVVAFLRFWASLAVFNSGWSGLTRISHCFMLCNYVSMSKLHPLMKNNLHLCGAFLPQQYWKCFTVFPIHMNKHTYMHTAGRRLPTIEDQ